MPRQDWDNVYIMVKENILMKKEQICVDFDDEKLDALQVYLKEKGIVLETELEETIQKLYEKHVPTAVRSFIERDRGVQELPKRRKRGLEDGENL